jgi:hypothetical protein
MKPKRRRSRRRRHIRASGGQDGRSERPARRYGVTPSRIGRLEGTHDRLKPVLHAHPRTTRRRSQRPQSVISTFAIHTAGGACTSHVSVVFSQSPAGMTLTRIRTGRSRDLRRSVNRQTSETFAPFPRSTSARRSKPTICSALRRFFIREPFPAPQRARGFSHKTWGTIWGGGQFWLPCLSDPTSSITAPINCTYLIGECWI